MNKQDTHILTKLAIQGTNMNETQPHSLVLHRINNSDKFS